MALLATWPPGLDALLDDQPGLQIRPSPAGLLRLEGDVRFRAAPSMLPEIQDSFQLRIDVPLGFPDDVPVVIETAGRIPRGDEAAHLYPDGSFCLGAPLRLLLIAKVTPSVLAFFDRCVVPALYNAAYRERHGGRLPLGELAHGGIGELDDYVDLFRVDTYRQALDALRLAGTKRRDANKQPCPCGCRRRLGVCRTNNRVRHVRDTMGRPQARQFADRLVARLKHEIAAYQSASAAS